MGKVLVIKGADFSVNGMKEDIFIAKNYAFTTVNGQIVELCQLANFSVYDFSNLKIEVVAQVSSFPTNPDRTATPIFGSVYSYIACGVDKDGVGVITTSAATPNTIISKQILLNTDYTFMLDTHNQVCSIGNSTEEFSASFSTGNRESLALWSFGSPSILDVAGMVKIKSVKLWNPTTNTLLADIKAGIYNGESGLFDSISKTILEPNSGNLGVE